MNSHEPSMSREPDGTDDLISDFAEYIQVMTPEQREGFANPNFRKVVDPPACEHGTRRHLECAWCLYGIEPPEFSQGVVTMTLTEFLTARFEEDEGLARAATPGSWVVSHTGTELRAPSPYNGFLLGTWANQHDQMHMLRHDPARVLVEVEAKRRIVEAHYFMAAHKSRDFGFDNGNCVTCRQQGPCETVRLLALTYADHPDWRDEWRP